MRRTLFGGVIFWTVVVSSTCYGTIFMLIPLLPLMVISPIWFRKLVDVFLTFYLSLLVVLIEVIYGVKVVVSGDKIRSDAAAGSNIVIMNHRTRLDWMFFWCCLYRHSFLNLHNQKISLKYPLKHLPGLGWATQFAAYIFMKKSLDQDKVTIERMLNYYRRVRKDINLIYFAEGTDKCPNSTERSRLFAAKNDLPHYQYVLHPRVTGFSFVTQKMLEGNFDSLYDVTVAYNRSIPQNETDLLRGEFPEEVHFHIKRYKRDDLLTDQHELETFCKELWKAKEDRLNKFYTEDPKFASSDEEGWSDQGDSFRRVYQILVLVYWIPFTLLAFYLTYSNAFIFGYVLAGAIGLIIVGVFFEGLDILQTKV